MKVTKKKPSIPLIQNSDVEGEERTPEETPGKRTFKCALCSKVVLQLCSKKSHALRIHGELVLFECGYCKKKFKGPEKEEVKNHIWSNHKDLNGNVDWQKLKDHKKDLKMEIEELTEMCFPTKKALNVGGKEEMKELQCVLCNFILRRRRSVVNHACSHANFVIYECKHCNRKFNSHNDMGSVRRHIRNHHDKNFDKNDIIDNKDKLKEKIKEWVEKCFPNL